jgi:hypothetical protein
LGKGPEFVCAGVFERRGKRMRAYLSTCTPLTWRRSGSKKSQIARIHKVHLVYFLYWYKKIRKLLHLEGRLALLVQKYLRY